MRTERIGARRCGGTWRYSSRPGKRETDVNSTCRHLILAFLFLVLLFLVVPRTAVADSSFFAGVTLTDTTAAPGDAAHAQVVFGFPFSTITRVCFYFTFGSDPLDPGELLVLDILDSGEVGGPGFQNGDQAPQHSRTLCNLSPSAFNNEFLDGVVYDLAMLAPLGPVTIRDLQVEVTGTPAVVGAK